MKYYSFVAGFIHCKKKKWKNDIPQDLGESPTFENPISPRSRGIPESSVSLDWYMKKLIFVIFDVRAPKWTQNDPQA